MKRILLLSLVVLLACGACDNSRDQVISQWPDGSPQLVFRVKGSKDNPTKIGERRYYENGKLQYEKHFSRKESTPCGDWLFYYVNGKKFAEGNFDGNHTTGDNWQFYSREGKAFITNTYDSMRVVEMSELGTPATVNYFSQQECTTYQFFSDGSLRCQGTTRNGLREGRWVFFHPNGLVQTEAEFVGGREEGVYIVNRENGIPYFRGQYHEGKRCGVWEFYDDEAHLVETKNFDE